MSGKDRRAGRLIGLIRAAAPAAKPTRHAIIPKDKRTMDPELKSLLQTLLETQIRTETTIGKAISGLAATVTQQAAAADARLTRIETNLDSLITIIRAEHQNGKARP